MTNTSIIRKVELLLTQAFANGSFCEARIELTFLRENEDGMYYLTKTTCLTTELCEASQDNEASFCEYEKARKAFLAEFNKYTGAGYQMV